MCLKFTRQIWSSDYSNEKTSLDGETAIGGKNNRLIWTLLISTYKSNQLRILCSDLGFKSRALHFPNPVVDVQDLFQYRAGQCTVVTKVVWTLPEQAVDDFARLCSYTKNSRAVPWCSFRLSRSLFFARFSFIPATGSDWMEAKRDCCYKVYVLMFASVYPFTHFSLSLLPIFFVGSSNVIEPDSLIQSRRSFSGKWQSANFATLAGKHLTT